MLQVRRTLVQPLRRLGGRSFAMRLLTALCLVLSSLPVSVFIPVLAPLQPTVAHAAAGDLDPAFGVGGRALTDFGTGSEEVRALAIQFDGKIVAAGLASIATNDFALARYNTDGSLDAAFGNGGKTTTAFSSGSDGIRAIAVQGDGKILAAGSAFRFDGFPGASDFVLARYSAGGALDAGIGAGGKVTTSFGASAWASARGMALQPDGKIVVGGHVMNGAPSDFALVRYNADGSLDAGFGNGGMTTTDFAGDDDQAYALALQPDGKILLAGHSSSINLALVRYNADGSLDAGFGNGGKVALTFGAGLAVDVFALALQPDGKIVAAGRTHNGVAYEFAVMRFEAAGNLDLAFGTGGRVVTGAGQATGVALQPNGKIVAAGNLVAVGDPGFTVARYTQAGAPDGSFGTGGTVTPPFATLGNDAFALALQADGKVVVGGYSSNNGTNYMFAVVRYLGTPPTGPFQVDSTVDAVDANPGDGVCADALGRCTLRAAVMEANAHAGADTISVPAGTYTLTTIPGQGVAASATGDLDVSTGEVTIEGAGASATIIQAGATPGSGIDRVFVVWAGATLRLDGVTVRHGNNANAGGGIYNSGGTVTVQNSTISGNSGENGGGIYNSGGTVTVQNSTISGNSGGISAGGGIYNSSNSTITVRNSTLVGNFNAYRGGGIYNAGTMTVQTSTLSGNSTFEGGGIYNYGEGTVTVQNSTISGNSATYGGGIGNGDGTVTVQNSTISGNSATYGGGIFHGGTVTVQNSTISGNSAIGGTGGGIYNSGGTVTVLNAIVAQPASGADCAGTTVTSQGHNLSSDATCGFTEPTDQQNTDPKLGPLADNGGPTQTHALLPGSPAIDAGGASCGVTTDQRGIARPQGAACDIGAFEAGEAETAPVCAAPPEGMAGWWPGDGNGDDLRGGSPGVLRNGASFASGKAGQAFLLDGIDNFIDAGNAPALQVSAAAFTVDTWVYFNALSHPPGANFGAPQGDMSIVDKMAAGGVNADGWRLLKQADNHFWFCLGGRDGNRCASPSHTVFSTTQVTTGVWYHVAAVKTASSFSLYVNGMLEDTRPLPSAPTFLDSNAANLSIGANAQEGAHLNGLIDEVEIFNRALSGAEIAAIYQAGEAGKCKTPAPAADSTPPVITPTVSGTFGNSGWYTSDIAVSWTVTDPESAISATSGCTAAIVNQDTAGASFTCSATSAGGASTQTVTVKRDATPPTVTGSRSPTANAGGWNNTDVTVSFSCSDSLSGVASCSGPTTLSSEGAGQSVTGSAVDQAGNTAPATVSNINIDKAAPVVTYTGNAGVYTVDQTVAITCEAADSLSGVATNTCASINGPAYSFALGANTFSATASDLAGNAGSGSTSFTVKVTYGSLCGAVEQLVSSKGIANSLCVKLRSAEAAEGRGNVKAKAGQVEAFKNEVTAQTGKALTPAQVGTLTALANGL